MRIRSLRTRIIVFFVALFAAVQLIAFVSVNAANTRNARAKIESELNVGERIFARLLEQNQQRLVQAARVLASDFAFREAVTSRDLPTVESALENHGSRVGARVMTLTTLNGSIVAAVGVPPQLDQSATSSGLLEAARRDGSASGIQVLGERAYQTVVVPVRAPLPVAWVALGFEVDDALARDLERLTELDVSFLRADAGSGWVSLADTLTADQRRLLLQSLTQAGAPGQLREIGSGADAQQTRAIVIAGGDRPTVIAVLQRSVAEAIHAFDRLRTTLLVLAIASLALTIGGSIVLALGMTRPLARIGAAAQRIRGGDYSQAVETGRADEIGELATNIEHMRTAIADREKEILRLAYRDPLTDLPNRALFNERLHHAIEMSERNGTLLNVLVMDLDRFKYVNDTLGHAVGDHVLREVSVRLSSLLRGSDTVARLGGDEFAILLEGGMDKRVLPVVNKVIKALEAPILYKDQPVDVGTSIGIANHPEHGRDAGTLLRNADIAMYVAKRTKSGYATYDPKHDTYQQEHLSLLGELRRAVERCELRVVYQPKVSIATREFTDAEALLRWEHPERGTVAPLDFIPFAEHTGYIKIITRWVLEQVVRQCATWRADGVQLRVSVNISTRDLMDRELPVFLAGLLARHGVPAETLCLEITESGFMEDPAHAQRVLVQLRQLGLVLSIDDYGTGFSSLSYIARLPVTELKIDRSFVQHMASDPTVSAIVKSTIELGHNLGLQVVAEGVENAAELRMLGQFGCDQAQGFYLSQPLSPERLTEWIEETHTAILRGLTHTG